MLDTLEQHASDRGIAGPSIPEAWSIRAHGLGARATDRWAVATAATSLLAFAGTTWILFSNAIMLPGASLIHVIFSAFIGPLALTISAVILLHRAGKVSSPAALFTSAGAVPAFGFTALTAASWYIGFDEADAGRDLSWFGSSTLPFLILAWITGTICLLASFSSFLGTQRSRPIRLVQSTALSAISALVLGVVLLLMGAMIGILGAAALLVLALRSSRSSVQVAPRDVVAGEARFSPPKPIAALSRRTVATVAVAALVSLSVGLGCAVFALTGSSWSQAVTDSTHAMNLGLATGALAAIPMVIAAGMVFTPRYGVLMRWSVLICCASLLVEATAQFLGVDHSLQWPLTGVAAGLLGFAIALPFGRIFSGRLSLRIGGITALGLAG